MLNPLAIKKPVGPAHALDEEDVLNTKKTLARLGYYKPSKRVGITPWPDTPMFEGIKTFQKDKDLKADGLLKPGGPTEKALNREIQPAEPKPGKPDPKKPTNDNRLAAVAAPLVLPIIPGVKSAIGAAIAALLGLTLPLKGDTQDNDESCNKLYYNVDTPTCNQVRKKRGKEAGARCHKSAADRYEACLRGISKDRLPPLDTWNN